VALREGVAAPGAPLAGVRRKGRVPVAARAGRMALTGARRLLVRHTRYVLNGMAAVLATGMVLGDAIISTVPRDSHPEKPFPVWVSDGVTEYQVGVHLDNTGLGGEPTDGAQWKFKNHPILSFVTGSESRPDPSEDFFAGIPMFWEIIAPPEQPSGRIVAPIGGGPVDHEGYLETFRFVVPYETTPGWYEFDMTSIKLFDPGGNLQPFMEIHDPVWIAPINPADFHHPPEITRDGYIDQADFQFLADNMNGPGFASPADIDGNGSADIADFARFQRCYTGTEPVSLPECE